jgi:manganese/iron transport system substrate-binding protein
MPSFSPPIDRRSFLAGTAATLFFAGPAKAAKLKAATSFTILRDMAANVAGEAMEIVSITEPGAEIHGYQPTPGDLLRAQDAAVILWNGLNLERWFERFLAGIEGAKGFVVTDGITPILISDGPYAGKPNPHAWMSPANGQRYVDAIASALAATDPANAALYAANAAAYKARIAALDAPFRARFAALPEAKRWLVTSEGAFSYLAADYGLKEAYIWPINADRQGTPQQMRRIIDTMRDNKVGVIFSESTISDEPARRVAEETGARYGGVLFVDQLSAADGPAPSYLDLLSRTIDTIATGLEAVA